MEVRGTIPITNSENSQISSQKEEKLSIEKQNYRIVTAKEIEEIKEYHYIPLPKFIDYININVLNESNKKDYYILCIRHLSHLSRKLMRALKLQNKCDIDITVVSSEIDVGIWSDDMTIHESIDEK